MRAALGFEDPQPTGRPRLRDFGPVESLLTGVIDRLGEVIAATVAAQGGKPPHVRPTPRPVTADDRLAGRRRIEAHEVRVAVWLA